MTGFLTIPDHANNAGYKIQTSISVLGEAFTQLHICCARVDHTTTLPCSPSVVSVEFRAFFKFYRTLFSLSMSHRLRTEPEKHLWDARLIISESE
jgi:hypothetical protein